MCWVMKGYALSGVALRLSKENAIHVSYAKELGWLYQVSSRINYHLSVNSIRRNQELHATRLFREIMYRMDMVHKKIIHVVHRIT